MNDMNYFVRQKTEFVPNSGFKLVKLYAYNDETMRLREPERRKLDVAGKKEFSDPRCRELLEVIVESNFNAGDFILNFN